MLLLLLLGQDEFRSPVGKADDGGTLQDCEDVGEGIATGDLQSWMLRPKDI